jgi:ClpP class serine protease
MPDDATTTPPRPSSADVLALLGAEPLALAPSAVRSLSAPAAMYGWDDENDEPGYELVGDLAVISVRGTLMQRGCWWWHGYDTLAAAFGRALLDGRARAVVLDLDSPGGYVAGCFDAARRMRAAADAAGKPVVAVSNERCYSAAYALACVADAIVVPETAGVGSVGIIGTMVSWSAALEAAGVDVRVIVSGAEKADGHPAQPLSDGAVAREQARVDQLADVFFAWVAERRPLTVAQVTALQAGIRLGPEAVTAKLADRVGTLAAILGGELSIEECCHVEAEGTEVNEVPVPAPGEGASRGEGRPIPPRHTMTIQLSTILAALGVSDPEKALQTANDLRAVRDQVCAVTGESDTAKALGALHAMKRDAAAANELRAQIEADKKAAAAKERASILDGAVTAMKLSPAERAQDGTAEGWTTALTNDALKAFVQRAGAVAPQSRPTQPTKGAAAVGGLTDEQKAIADQVGISHDDYAKALAQG